MNDQSVPPAGQSQEAEHPQVDRMLEDLRNFGHSNAAEGDGQGAVPDSEPSGELPKAPEDIMQRGEDTLDEAEEESFPASDPPAVHPHSHRD